MPTLQLPRDDRWGGLGAGLSNLLGSVVEGVRQRQVTNGVAQIWSDPAVPDDQKLVQALRTYGDQGGQVGLQLLKAKTLAAQLQDITAQIGQRQAQTGLARTRQEQLREQIPYTGQLEQAKIGREAAGAKASEAEAGLRTAEIGMVPARLQAERQLGGERAASTEKTEVERDIKKIELGQLQKGVDQAGKAQVTGTGHPMDMSLALMPNLGEDTKAAAKSIYDGTIAAANQTGNLKIMQSAPVEAQKAALAYAQKNQQSKTLSEPAEKVISASIQSASAAKTFLTAFEARPNTGLFSGAPLLAYIEKHGGSTGDINLLTQNDANLRLTAENLSAGGMGGGFMSTLRLKFAADLAPGLMKSPLANLINLDLLANAKLSELQARKSNLDPRTTKEARASVDQAINDWQEVKNATSAYQSYVTPKGQTVLTHNGSLLDAKNFRTIIDANKSYETRKGTTYSGSQLTDLAQRGIPAAPNPMTGEELKRLLGIR